MSGQILEEIKEESRIKEEKLPKEELINLPENTSIYRCNHCKYIFKPKPHNDVEMIIVGSIRETCPLCEKEGVELLCKVDVYSILLKENHIVDCRKATIIPKTDLCPVCKKSMCPECYNHSCVSLSRVTGYIQDVSGWNEGKKQELIDRKRYLIEKGGTSRIQ